MSVPRLFYCTVAGFVAATLLSFLFGASGLLNYRRLQEHEGRVAAAIAALEQRNADLERLLTQLRTEPEVVRLLAREIGYYRSGELVIDVAPPAPAGPGGNSPYVPDFADVGPLLQPGHPLPRDPFNVLALGLFLGLGLFAVLTARALLGRRPEPAAADLPPVVAGTVEDAAAPEGRPAAGLPRAAAPAPEPAAAAVRSGAARHGRPPAAAGGAESSSPRRSRRARRRGEVTVYRL